MKINVKPILLGLATGACLLHTPVFAESGWTVRGHLGYSQLSDQDASANGLAPGATSADAEVSGGFVSGLGLLYRYNTQWAAEIGWEYRTNDSETSLDNGDVFSDGNYASNIFYLNGLYSLTKRGNWTPYLGAGLIWVQEIDIDLENSSTERSFSDSGDMGFQVFAGVRHPLTENIDWHAEARYGAISSIDLEEESGSGTLKGLDYKPLTVQLGLDYHF